MSLASRGVFEKKSGRVMRADAASRPGTRWWQRTRCRVALVSAMLLTPCFWHQHIEAGDLGSHVYNAWLVQLIHEGRAPGLSVAPMWNNVLFDWMLSGVGQGVGVLAAEKIVVPACVLIFFWGAFLLGFALTRRWPWQLAPVLAAIAYGWTFHMGFFNYYLAIGLSFWALAALIVLRGWWKLATVPLGALTLVAHPMGLLWLVVAAGFLGVISQRKPRLSAAVWVLAIAAAGLIRHHLRTHYETEYFPLAQLSGLNGADQLVLSTGYRLLPFLVGAYFVGVLGAEYLRIRRDPGAFWSRAGVPVQLYLVLLVGAWAIPNFIVMPEAGRFGFVSPRFSLILAVGGCCVLSAVEYRRRYAVVGAIVAAVFFTLNFRQTAALDRMETKIGTLLQRVGREDRVIATLAFPPAGTRLAFNHMVDRQCVGRCWSYGNYEPATGHFRVRAEPGNRIVATTKTHVDDMWGGAYVIQPADVPVWGIYQESADPMSIAIRPLRPGEKSGRPDPAWRARLQAADTVLGPRADLPPSLARAGESRHYGVSRPPIASGPSGR